MKIHHLNCGTLCPTRLVRRFGMPAAMICHCLLLETERHGLVLIDSGFGTQDPPKIFEDRLQAAIYQQSTRRATETAVAQVLLLGFKTTDVRHILLTHLDRDHAGALPDFPWAKIHVSASEFEVAGREDISRIQRLRYRRELWKHSVDWQLYSAEGE